MFVIGPDKKIKLILVYPMTTGRNFDEVLRVIDSLQLTAKHKVSTPVNWKPGEDVVIAGSVNDDQAKEMWPDGWDVAEAVHPDRQAAGLTFRRRRIREARSEGAPRRPLRQGPDEARRDRCRLTLTTESRRGGL